LVIVFPIVSDAYKPLLAHDASSFDQGVKMTDLERLIAERACERLIQDYAAFNDASDWDAVAALYLPAGRMSRPTAPDVFIEGRDAILGAFQARPPRATRHICANIRVTIASETRATATSQILLYTAADALPLMGSYADIFGRTDDGWCFAERRGSLDFLT
jgi:ketosteroid isomerase-like protein